MLKNAEDALSDVYKTGRDRLVLIKSDGDSKLIRVCAEGVCVSHDKDDPVLGNRAGTARLITAFYDNSVVPRMKTEEK